MMNMNCIRRIAVALTACLISGQAVAACQQSDIAGEWQAYLQTYQRGVEPFWSACNFNIKSNGVMDFNGQSFCRNNWGGNRPLWGYFQLSGTAACVFSGYIVQDGIKITIPRMTLNRSKDTIAGVGDFPGGKLPHGNFVFTAVQP